ncbi:MAG TPA: hypothetical protein DCE23_06990 [Firmicutes bacterium]|nr:hypothetical protein [Bacillota bacterium]
MNFLKKHKIVILSITIIILCFMSVILWNFIVRKQKEKKEEEPINVLDINNVPSVDAKLNGEDYPITQLYLLSYSKHKSGIWYMSSGYVSRISKRGTDVVIVLTEGKNSNIVLTTSINEDKANVKVGDLVNFVGTVDIKSGEVHLSKISHDPINYASVTEISLSDLVNNIKLIKDTYFLVSGYMVTDQDKYKLYDSKDNYNKDNSVGNYFLIDWNEVKYTGNQNVILRCKLEDTYALGNCSLME